MFYVAGVSHAHAKSWRDNKRIIGKPILNVDHFQPSQTGSSFILIKLRQNYLLSLKD